MSDNIYSDRINIEVHICETRYNRASTLIHNDVHRLHGCSESKNFYSVHTDARTYKYPIKIIERIVETKVKNK